MTATFAHDPDQRIAAMAATCQRIWDDAANQAPATTPTEDAASFWGERRAEDRAYEDALLRAREEDARW